MSFLSVNGLPAGAAQALGLQVPGRGQAAPDGARQEAPEALAQARAGRVLGRGHAHVVAAVVLDEEVPVAGLGQRHLGQPLLHARALVAQLVRGVDADAAHQAHGQGQAQALDEAQVAVGPEPARPDQGGELERDVRVRAEAVVAVPLQALEHAVGRVGRVLADRRVQRGHDHVQEHRAEEPEHAEAGGLDQAPGDERDHRDQQAQQPGVALGVGPVQLVELDVLVLVVVGVCAHG